MSPNVAEFKWTSIKAAAAQLVAEDKFSNIEIAEKCGVTNRQLERWKQHPYFQARVNQIVEDTASALKKKGIRLKENRLNNLQLRVSKMMALIEARGAEMTGEIAGGETGLLARDYKGKEADIAVYRFDAALMKELREHEKQTAIELGEWTEKQEVKSNYKLVVEYGDDGSSTQAAQD